MDRLRTLHGNTASQEHIEKLLEENHQLIIAALDCQNKGKFQDCLKYQERLQRNLFYLASLADTQMSNLRFACRSTVSQESSAPKRMQQPTTGPGGGQTYANVESAQQQALWRQNLLPTRLGSERTVPIQSFAPMEMSTARTIEGPSVLPLQGQSPGGPGGGQNSSSEDKREVRFWSQEEHNMFLEGLSKFQRDGKPDLRAIAEYMGTRTATQVRSHYQKYLLKLKKEQHDRSSAACQDAIQHSSFGDMG